MTPERACKTFFKFAATVALLTQCMHSSWAAQEKVLRYTVRQGDSLIRISKQNLHTQRGYQDLAQFNRIEAPYLIRAGAKLRIPIAWLAAKTAPAKLQSFKGDVQIGGLDGTWQSAKPGQNLQTGQQVRLGRNSSAQIKFADNSELVAEPETTLSLDTLSVFAGGYMADTRLRLQTGTVQVRSNPQGKSGQRFDIITPAAIASVRGTEFAVQAQDERTIAQTLEGRVLVQNPLGSAMVERGFASLVKKGEAPPPPSAIEAAPSLQQAPGQFNAFPIQFAFQKATPETPLVAQVGQDERMAQLHKELRTTASALDFGLLDNGQYHLKAWGLDAQGIPSYAVRHTFEVQIPRQLHTPPLQLPQNYFSSGAVHLSLAPLQANTRYMLRLTQDPQGQQTLWEAINQDAQIQLPAPQTASAGPYHLWVWTYQSATP